ncbi:Duplicated ATPase component MtsB of energizing module of methionine-regulated ECF transporter [Streptococcus sp. DD12]|nr:Duplicated ATPase component MtsB of energizing module of methionine-regulated ECF transporter [Streptococcus sp. DD12]
MTMTDWISFEQFSYTYEAQSEPTLKEITLGIEKGKKVLIVGPSGSGKSTLGQCLNGIIPNIYKGQASGRLTIAGKEAFDLSIYDKSQLVSTVLQDPDGQFIGLSVAEDIAFSLENDVTPLDDMREAVDKWSKALNLGDLLQHRPQDLSGGQKQRVSLAGVLVDESPILLFDEPLANLDPKSGQDTIDLIDRIHKETGATTLIIEHRLEDVLHRQVDQIILINEGRIVFDGRPDDLLQTDLLRQNGIREPLYISALRDMGADLTQLRPLAQLDQLDLSQVQAPDLPDLTKPLDRPLLLEAEHLQFAYQADQPILKDLSLTIGAGERLAIVGKNGAGKSTLAKALCQFINTQGQLRYQGQDISGDSIAERANRIGYVLQNPNQMISQTMIYDEVALGLRLRGVDEATVKEKVEQALTICGLYPFRKWPISALSFGQKKRVTIAAILVLEPQVLLLDEPTAGQDHKHYTEIMTFLDELQARGHTIVMITHDMQLLTEYSDRVVVVLDGQVLFDSRPETLFGQVTVLEQAYLKTTSLYTLAKRLGVDPARLTQAYISRRKEEAHGN